MSSKSKHHKKKRVILPYIIRPVVYTLISLVFIVPMCLGMLNAAVNLVHRAQPSFPSDISEIVLNDSAYSPSDRIVGAADIPKLYAGDKIGVLSCDEAGLSTAVYYGANRISYRQGAGLKSKYSLPGQGGIIKVSSNASGGFKALENVEKDDIITFTTSWGVYEYKVKSLDVLENMPEPDSGEVLIMSTESSKDAFSNYSDKRLYVTADYISGPSAEEVQQ